MTASGDGQDRGPALYRNAGAPIVRTDTGQVIQRGAVFLPTAFELKRYAHKLRPVADRTELPAVVLVTAPGHTVQNAVSAGATAEGGAGDGEASRGPHGVAEVNARKGWPLEIAPALYLKLNPTGPYAALAQSLTGSAPAVEASNGADD